MLKTDMIVSYKSLRLFYISLLNINSEVFIDKQGNRYGEIVI